jgi:hypothetical protein
MAKGAAVLQSEQNDVIDQCARILGVCLWRDVDDVLFGILVDDLINAAIFTSGGTPAGLGDVDDSAETRGNWIAYYEQWADAHTDQLLYELGYGL